MKTASLIATVLAVTMLLSACAGRTNIGGASDLALLPGEDLPVPTVADMEASNRPYRVGPFDKLTIDVFGTEDLSAKEVQVDASGRIGFPLIGTVEVAGKTPGEIAVAMQDRLRGRFIRDPQVTVNLKEIVSQTVTIGGEVKKPGDYPILGQMTLMTAIALAQGWTDISNKGEVVVFRTISGKRFAAIYDVKAIERGRYGDPELYAKDVVMVGESERRKIWKDFLGASPLLAPVIYLLGNKN